MISGSEQRADPEDPFKDVKPKRCYMHKGVLDKFGMTLGCNGCLALLIGAPSANHSEVCRRRIEGELAKCGGQNQKKFEESEAKRAKKKEVRFPDRGVKIPPDGNVREGEPPVKKTTAESDHVPDPTGVDTDDMTLADYGKRVPEADLVGRGVR